MTGSGVTPESHALRCASLTRRNAKALSSSRPHRKTREQTRRNPSHDGQKQASTERPLGGKQTFAGAITSEGERRPMKEINTPEVDVLGTASRMLDLYGEEHPESYQQWLEREAANRGLDGLEPDPFFFLWDRVDTESTSMLAKILFHMRSEIRRRNNLDC
jgi:hypothetical protein